MTNKQIPCQIKTSNWSLIDKHVYFVLLLYMFIACHPFVSHASEPSVSGPSKPSGSPLFSELGITTGYGFGENTDENYRPVMFLGNMSICLQKNNYYTRGKGTLNVYFEPQFNPVLSGGISSCIGI